VLSLAPNSAVDKFLALLIACRAPAKYFIEAAKTTQTNIRLIEAAIIDTGGSDAVQTSHPLALSFDHTKTMPGMPFTAFHVRRYTA